MKKFSLNIIFFCLGVGISMVLFALNAWTGPTANPLSENLEGTIYADNSNQQKTGPLSLTASTTALVVDPGKIGIGTLLPGGKLGLGTSTVYIDNDESGNMIFADTAVGSTTLSAISTNMEKEFSNNGDLAEADRSLGNTDAYGLGIIVSSTQAIYIENNGNIGIATNTPDLKLDVDGGIKLGTYATCNSNTAGTIIYDSWIKICNGTTWVEVKVKE